MKNLEKNLDINETNLLKMVNRLKNLKFVDFENLKNKYFYQVLEEEDEIYKLITGFEQKDTLIKEGQGIYKFQNAAVYEG